MKTIANLDAVSVPLQVKIVTKLDWPSFRYIAKSIQCSLKPQNDCTLHRWNSVRPGGKIIFLGTVDKYALDFLETLTSDSEIIWYATTEGISRIDSENRTTSQSLKIVAASNFVKQMVEPIGIHVDGILHHGLDMAERKIDDCLYRKWKIRTKGRNVILTVSANDPRKGLDKLISAYEMIMEEDQDTYLIIHSQKSGYYNLRKLSKRMTSKRVWLTNRFGRMTRTQLNSLYKLCSVYVQPSLSEGFGMPLLEAFRFGKGVIAVDAPPFNEIVKNGQSGILFASNEVTWRDFKKSIKFRLHEYATSDLAHAISTYLFDVKLKSKIEVGVDRLKWQWDASRLYPQLLNYFT